MTSKEKYVELEENGVIDYYIDGDFNCLCSVYSLGKPIIYTDNIEEWEKDKAQGLLVKCDNVYIDNNIQHVYSHYKRVNLLCSLGCHDFSCVM